MTDSFTYLRTGSAEIQSKTHLESNHFLNCRYYPALKTIELLEHTYLPLIKKHKFASAMEQKLPRFRKHIEEASMTELKDFLESIHEYSARIGSSAIQQVLKFSSLLLPLIFRPNEVFL